jgi:hypothetical protein
MIVVPQDCPANTGQLVGHRHGGFILAAFGHYAVDPLVQFILFVSRMNNHRSGPMDEATTKVTVSPLADTEKDILATSTMLTWN